MFPCCSQNPLQVYCIQSKKKGFKGKREVFVGLLSWLGSYEEPMPSNTKRQMSNWRYYHVMHFFFLFIGQEPSTCPEINCLQIMINLCLLLPSKCVFPIILSFITVATLLFVKWQISSQSSQRVI